ncbi:hypothetical protein QBC43DRAFT_283593 [Cladorrhinum sp. PSN259]|nr:hypothetical protein QBC43DRAFT_283593 [Cladorrhinum sp. PSN259]
MALPRESPPVPPNQSRLAFEATRYDVELCFTDNLEDKQHQLRRLLALDLIRLMKVHIQVFLGLWFIQLLLFTPDYIVLAVSCGTYSAAFSLFAKFWSANASIAIITQPLILILTLLVFNFPVVSYCLQHPILAYESYSVPPRSRLCVTDPKWSV